MALNKNYEFHCEWRTWKEEKRSEGSRGEERRRETRGKLYIFTCDHRLASL